MDVVKLPKKVRMVCYEIMDGKEEALDTLESFADKYPHQVAAVKAEVAYFNLDYEKALALDLTILPWLEEWYYPGRLPADAPFPGQAGAGAAYGGKVPAGLWGAGLPSPGESDPQRDGPGDGRFLYRPGDPLGQPGGPQPSSSVGIPFKGTRVGR